MGTEGQQLFGVGAWSRKIAEGRAGYIVERRHEDGRRWVAVRTFETKQAARAALDSMVAGGTGREDLRVRRVG